MTPPAGFYEQGFRAGVFDPFAADCQDDPDELLVDFLGGVVKNAPGNEEALRLLSSVHARRGEMEQSLHAREMLASLRPRDPWAHYSLACTYSRMFLKDQALVSLARAAGLGFRELGYMLSDRSLDYVRTDGRFHAIVRYLRENSGRP